MLEYVYQKLKETLNSFIYKPIYEVKPIIKSIVDNELKKLLYPLNKQDFFITCFDINYFDDRINFDIHRDYSKYPMSDEERREKYRNKKVDMSLPKIELTPGYNYACQTSCGNYTDVCNMLEDIIAGLQEYPDAELLSYDDPKTRRIGYCLRFIDGAYEWMWEFMILLTDLRKTIASCAEKYPEWDKVNFSTQIARAELANSLMLYAKNVNNGDEERGGLAYL